ncbi:MAG: preprotein translocase subunit SecG [Betaproteobacteria bacterium]|nr:MAG: preprotein translocase subunit SecG [Betaproteobacteria bacterium]TAG48163.1 MAG: preprotein translocase subunit SecG [Betaproteobacteria bacterium]
MEIFLLAIHIIAAIAILVLVLLQQGKGADMGAAFGSGSAGSVFGASGSANFLSRSTSVAATVFFATSIVLTYLAANRPSVAGGVMQGVSSESSKTAAPQSDSKATPPATVTAPAAPAAPAQSSTAPTTTGGVPTPVAPKPEAPKP